MENHIEVGAVWFVEGLGRKVVITNVDEYWASRGVVRAVVMKNDIYYIPCTSSAFAIKDLGTYVKTIDIKSLKPHRPAGKSESVLLSKVMRYNQNAWDCAD